MQKINDFSIFIENYNGAFMVASLIDNKLLYINKKGEKELGFTIDNCDFSKILDLTDKSIQAVISMSEIENINSMIYNHKVTKSNGEQFVVDLLIGYYDIEHSQIFIELIYQSDTRMQTALNQINVSTKAQAIVNLDEDLSIVHCNEAFDKVFESDEKLRHSHYKNSLVNGFLSESREQLINNILQTLKVQQTFSTKIKVYSVTGKEYWYLLELERRTLDNSGNEKVIAHMTNIEKQVEIEEENSYLNQYFSIFQELTTDVLYRVEMPSKTLYHNTPKAFGDDIGLVVPNHVEKFIKEKIIHPEDVGKYMQQLKEFISDEGQQNRIPIRVAVFNNEYKWYTFIGKKVLDSNNNIKEVVGALVNIDETYKITEKADTLSNYFDALELISGESFYIIDVKRRVLKQKGEVAKELDLHEEVPNFPESVFERIHKDDLDKFKEYSNKSYQGEPANIQMRIIMKNGEYKWYELYAQPIKDGTGELVEIFGKMNNIQTRIDLEKKANFDKLTKVLSREMFEQTIIKELRDMKENECNALIFIDIDDFKYINDNYGHSYGDFILQKFAQRVGNCIKQTDLMGRVGGDEFVIYLKGICSCETAIERANYMLEQMKRPISNGDITHTLGLSIGIAITPENGTELGILYENADKALYESKRKGKNTATLYCKDMK